MAACYDKELHSHLHPNLLLVLHPSHAGGHRCQGQAHDGHRDAPDEHPVPHTRGAAGAHAGAGAHQAGAAGSTGSREVRMSGPASAPPCSTCMCPQRRWQASVKAAQPCYRQPNVLCRDMRVLLPSCACTLCCRRRDEQLVSSFANTRPNTAPAPARPWEGTHTSYASGSEQVSWPLLLCLSKRGGQHSRVVVLQCTACPSLLAACVTALQQNQQLLAGARRHNPSTVAPRAAMTLLLPALLCTCRSARARSWLHRLQKRTAGLRWPSLSRGSSRGRLRRKQSGRTCSR